MDGTPRPVGHTAFVVEPGHPGFMLPCLGGWTQWERGCGRCVTMGQCEHGSSQELSGAESGNLSHLHIHRGPHTFTGDVPGTGVTFYVNLRQCCVKILMKYHSKYKTGNNTNLPAHYLLLRTHTLSSGRKFSCPVALSQWAGWVCGSHCTVATWWRHTGSKQKCPCWS